ncbi:MAG: HXXEE domain-containing protein [Anaerolineales bacterium]|nr:HXXEE domain-containing protein [Anaerolineales bacterium]
MNDEKKRFTLYTQLLNGISTVLGLIFIGQLILNPSLVNDPNWVYWLLVVTAGMHTFEEYTFPGGFTKWFNTRFFDSKNDDLPLSAKRAFYTDAAAGVVILLTLAFTGAQWPWLTLGIACIFFINGSWHLTNTITRGVYSPGAVTSALFNLPLGGYVVYFYVANGLASPYDIGIAYAIGLLMHIGFFGAMRRFAAATPK